jgi:hypothetical protein
MKLQNFEADPTRPTTASGVAGDVSGTVLDTTVTGLQGTPVSDTPPTTGQDLVYDGSAWTPVLRRYAATIGGATSIAVTHGLASLDVTVQVRRVSDGASVWCEADRTDANTVTLVFGVAPAVGSMRVMVAL